MSERAVSVCSPPDSSESVAGFLPGGFAMISSAFERVFALDHFEAGFAAARKGS